MPNFFPPHKNHIFLWELLTFWTKTNFKNKMELLFHLKTPLTFRNAETQPLRISRANASKHHFFEAQSFSWLWLLLMFFKVAQLTKSLNYPLGLWGTAEAEGSVKFGELHLTQCFYFTKKNMVKIRFFFFPKLNFQWNFLVKSEILFIVVRIWGMEAEGGHWRD